MRTASATSASDRARRASAALPTGAHSASSADRLAMTSASVIRCCWGILRPRASARAAGVRPLTAPSQEPVALGDALEDVAFVVIELDHRVLDGVVGSQDGRQRHVALTGRPLVGRQFPRRDARPHRTVLDVHGDDPVAETISSSTGSAPPAVAQ